MKGIIFNLFAEVITHERGEDAWDDLLESLRLDGVYTSLGSYPDTQFIKLVHAASAILGLSPDGVLRLFGSRSIPLLAQKYPVFFEGHQSARSFLLTLNDIIHPEVRKIYPGADVPDFAYDTTSPDVLQMIYSSPRKLCSLAEGLIQGSAAHYRERAELTQTECMHRGDSRCVFRIAFAQAES